MIPVDDIKGDDTALYVADTVDGTTYRALSAIPNATNSFYGAAIPEPATLLLICGAAAPVLLKRRRRQ
ncbi:MAG: PEP-CTERM sorting domain-containing protein [Phycisphaerae bacterium]